jgi:hypothetical protein
VSIASIILVVILFIAYINLIYLWS